MIVEPILGLCFTSTRVSQATNYCFGNPIFLRGHLVIPLKGRSRWWFRGVNWKCALFQLSWYISELPLGAERTVIPLVNKQKILRWLCYYMNTITSVYFIIFLILIIWTLTVYYKLKIIKYCSLYRIKMLTYMKIMHDIISSNNSHVDPDNSY